MVRRRIQNEEQQKKNVQIKDPSDSEQLKYKTNGKKNQKLKQELQTTREKSIK